jgi:Tol biopolymer transport system component
MLRPSPASLACLLACLPAALMACGGPSGPSGKSGDAKVAPAAKSPAATDAPAKDATAPAPTVAKDATPTDPTRPLPEEKHLGGPLRQLTNGGENAEAYFSADEQRLIFQSTRDGATCDQIYTLTLADGAVNRVSSGKGRTTCAYFLPGDRVLYASTHAAADDCLPEPDRSRGYVWKLYPEFDIYTAKTDGSDVQPLVTGPGYDAEATVSPQGDRIVFTSTRDGDPELYVINVDGTGLKRLTETRGYDGGAFFSPDGKRIVYRANHPEGAEELAKYDEIIKDHLVRPTRLELFVMNADGSGSRQITSNGKANFAPFFHPDGKRIIFSSNQADPKGRDFDLFLINDDGSNQEQVTFNKSFDGFPMFTRDGKTLVFASNRGALKEGDTNVFLANWID